MKIKLAVSDRYGMARYYPVDQPAWYLCQVVRQKTLTHIQVELLEKAGVKLDLIPFNEKAVFRPKEGEE